MTRHKICLIRLERTRLIGAVPGAVATIFALAVMAAVACSGLQPVTPSEITNATSVPEPPPTSALTTNSNAVRKPTPTRLPVDGETWILESVDGQPLVHGMYATLTIDGPQFGGFDGCNSFGGRHEDGKPVVKPDGTISVPGFAITDADCPMDAMLDQSNRYREAMTQQATARVVGDQMHIIDGSGAVVLVFFKQEPLIGHPIELAGTA